MEGSSKKEKDLSYGYVEVFENSELGIGCYGRVYKAKCGQLPCVAKVFHDSLFQFDPANEQAMSSKVEKDCRHLSSIKHPHLVTYLGFVRDAKTKRLLLLMEAMDENLSNHLERRLKPLPLNMQVSFSYDIALAISYLHSIKCIHRNLSANNILLIAGRRAKISDYGITSFATFGTIQVYPSPYMPPEVRLEPSHYTLKTDIFSFGVLVVQIATSQPPNPTSAVPFLDSTTGEANSEVHQEDVDKEPQKLKEIDRRKSDIAKMDIDNPLMQLALDCLKDKESARPSANDLCHFIEIIRPSENGKNDSIPASATPPSSPASDGKLTESTIIDNFRKKLGQLLQELSDRNEEIADRDNEIKVLDNLLVEKTEKLAALEKLVQEKNETLGGLQRKRSTKDRGSTKQQDSSETITENKKNTKEETKQGDMEQKKKPTRYVPRKSLGQLPLQWSSGQAAPRPLSLYTGYAVADGTRAYLSFVSNIYTYTIATNKWIRLPECSQRYFSLALVHQQVVIIGGIQGDRDDGVPVNTLKSLAPNKIWDEFLPPMPTSRAFAASITTSEHLIVAGGKDKPDSEGLLMVEVLHLENLQWATVSNLPELVKYPYLTLNEKFVYFTDAGNNRVYKCSLQDIVPPETTPMSMKEENTTGTDEASSKEDVEQNTPAPEVTKDNTWKKICNLPVSGGVRLLADGGLLLAFGGHDNKYRPSKNVVCYNQDSDSWKTVGSLATPKWGVLPVSLPTRKIMIVGGHLSTQETSNTTDITSLNPEP